MPFYGDEVRTLAVAYALYKTTETEDELDDFYFTTRDVLNAELKLDVVVTNAQYLLSIDIAKAIHRDAKKGISLEFPEMFQLGDSDTMMIRSASYEEMGYTYFMAYPRNGFIADYIDNQMAG